MKLFCEHILRLVIGVLILNVASSMAVTPTDYKKRVDGIRSHINELIECLDDPDPTYEQETIAKILKAVPQSEKIEWPGGKLETDNLWLKTSLERVANEENAAEREAILISIDERIAAISDSVGKLEETIKNKSTKDADKQKLAEILAREEYQRIKIREESVFEKWWRDFLDWITSLLPKPNFSSTSGLNFAPLTLALQVLIFVLVLAFIGFLLWRLLPFFAGRFGREAKKDKRRDRVILGEKIRGDESASDLFDEAELLARRGDLRDAIRKGYIALLCELGDRNFIRLEPNKTNQDYLHDLRQREQIYNGVFGLTNNFERNWYGLREAVPADWEDFRARYLATIAEAKIQSR